jgi:hypothetical protein
VPLLVWSILLADLADLVSQFFLELRFRAKEVVGELFDNRLDVGMVSDFVNEVERLLFNLDIMVLEAVGDGAFVPLNSVVIDVNYFLELVKSNIPNVVFSVCQEAAKDVDSESSQTLVCLDSHNGSCALTQH